MMMTKQTNTATETKTANRNYLLAVSPIARLFAELKQIECERLERELASMIVIVTNPTQRKV